MVTVVCYIVGGRRHFVLFLFSRFFFRVEPTLDGAYLIPVNR